MLVKPILDITGAEINVNLSNDVCEGLLVMAPVSTAKNTFSMAKVAIV